MFIANQKCLSRGFHDKCFYCIMIMVIIMLIMHWNFKVWVDHYICKKINRYGFTKSYLFNNRNVKKYVKVWHHLIKRYMWPINRFGIWHAIIYTYNFLYMTFIFLWLCLQLLLMYLIQISYFKMFTFLHEYQSAFAYKVNHYDKRTTVYRYTSICN